MNKLLQSHRIHCTTVFKGRAELKSKWAFMGKMSGLPLYHILTYLSQQTTEYNLRRKNITPELLLATITQIRLLKLVLNK